MIANRTRRASVAAVAAVAAMVAAGFSLPARAGQAGDIPAFVRAQHQELLSQLSALTQRPAPVGVEAGKLLGMVSPQIRRHEDVLLPVLAVLPMMAGSSASDMGWALSLIDRVRSQQPLNYREEQKIDSQVGALAAAARQAGDSEALAVGARVADSLAEDDEVIQPTVLLVGQHLRPKPRVGM